MELVAGATQQIGPRLHEVTIRTALLDRDTKVRVLLPVGYEGSDQRYPVLFLYHGGTEDHSAWSTPGKGEAERATNGLDLIVVMPDNGPYDYSVDWFNEGRFGNPRWETYTFEHLIPWVDATYRTIAERRARAAAGVSLGGHAAMSYVARRPDLYGAVASFSGQVDTNNPTMHALMRPLAPHVNGSFEDHAVRWRGANPFDLAANLRGIDISLFTGTGTGESHVVDGIELPDLEAMVHEDAVSLHERLNALGIAHTLDDYGRGTHTWDYFQRDLVQWLPRLMQHFGAAGLSSVPASFTYSSIKPTYDIFGWRVVIERPALEFSAIEVHGSGRFDIFGSGQATVETGPTFEPGQHLIVTVHDASGSNTTERSADRDGRLSLAVSLGAGNEHQQYSTAATAMPAPRAARVCRPGDLPFLVTGGGSSFFRGSVRVRAAGT